MVKDAFCVVVVRNFGRDKLIVVCLLSELFQIVQRSHPHVFAKVCIEW